MIETIFTKQEAYPWFRETAEKLGADSGAVAQAWEVAWELVEGGALPELWKGWIRQTVQQALSKAKLNPTGLWLTILKEGPKIDLKHKAAPRPVEDSGGVGLTVTYEQLKRIREMENKDSDPDHQSLPSMAAVVALKERGWKYVDAWAAVQAEWEKQGQPWSRDFDWSPLGLEAPK